VTGTRRGPAHIFAPAIPPPGTIASATVAWVRRSGVEEVFDVQVLPGLRRPLLSGPFAGQDGGEVIWKVPLMGGEPA
jgi:hypothetical protein